MKRRTRHHMGLSRQKIRDIVAEIRNALVLPKVLLWKLANGKTPSRALAKEALGAIDEIVNWLKRLIA